MSKYHMCFIQLSYYLPRILYLFLSLAWICLIFFYFSNPIFENLHPCLQVTDISAPFPSLSFPIALFPDFRNTTLVLPSAFCGPFRYTDTHPVHSLILFSQYSMFILPPSWFGPHVAKNPPFYTSFRRFVHCRNLAWQTSSRGAQGSLRRSNKQDSTSSYFSPMETTVLRKRH